MMIDTAELYILMLFMWPWPWNKVMGIQEIKNFCANNLPQLSKDMDGIATLLRLVDTMYLIIALSHTIHIWGG